MNDKTKATRMFNKKWLMENVMHDTGEGVEAFPDVDMNDEHRWYRVLLRVFRFEGKCYGVTWGAAKGEDGEHQYFKLKDSTPPDIELKEMHQVEVKRLEWQDVTT